MSESLGPDDFGRARREAEAGDLKRRYGTPLDGTPPIAPPERAMLAAPILAKWCDPGESFAGDRANARITKALQLADLLWEAAHR